MADNKDIAVLAKKVYELSALTLEELEARKWEALLIINSDQVTVVADITKGRK